MTAPDVLVDGRSRGANSVGSAEQVATAMRTGWARTRLADLANVRYGKARPKAAGSVQVVGSGGVFGTTDVALTAGETLVVGRKGAAGSVIYCGEPCYPSDTTFYLDWTQEVCVPFIYNEMLWRGLAPDRSVIPSLARSDVEGYTLSLPPLPEQRAIACVLRAIQDAIQARRRELDLERERKAALMQHLFTKGTRGEPTKQTEIGEMPESWEILELGDVATLHRGYDLPTRERVPGPVPIVSSSGITGTHTEARVVGPGVVTGRYGTIGEVFYVEQDFWPLNTTLYVSDFHGTNPEFISYLLRTLDFTSFNDKSTVPGVNRNDLHRIAVRLPGPDEQREIADVMRTWKSVIEARERELVALDELFHALLEELMTGRLPALPLVDSTGA